MTVVAQHPAPEDLTLFALGSLTPEDAAAVRTHAANCAECQAELALVNLDLAHLALDVPAEVPSPGARQRFLARVENEASLPGFREAPASSKSNLVAMPPVVSRNAIQPPAESAPVPGPPRSRPGSWAMPWAVATAFALLAIGAGIDNFLLRDRLHNLSRMAERVQAEAGRLQAEASRASDVLAVLTAPTAQRVTLTAGKTPPQPTGRAGYLRERGRLIFTASNLAPLPPNKIYELWLIPVSGKPIPAGTFAPDTQGSASVVFPKIPVGVEARAFGVTLENEGGSDTPTAPILLQGS